MRSWMAVLSILAGVGTAGCLFRGDDTDALRQRARQKIVNDPSARAVIEGNNAFALDLFNHLEAAGKGNLVIAPASVSTALAMAWEAAEAVRKPRWQRSSGSQSRLRESIRPLPCSTER